MNQYNPELTRALSPDEFSSSVPAPTAIANTSQPSADDVRLAAILSGLKAARKGLDAADPAQVQSAERQVMLHAGYLLGLLEERGVSIPAVALFSPPIGIKDATDDLIRNLEDALAKTRLVFLLAFGLGVVVGYGLGKIIGG